MNVSPTSCDASAGRPTSELAHPARDAAVDVFLVPLGGGRLVFFSEEPRPRHGEGEAPAPGRGFRGWLERKYRRLKGEIEHSEGGLGRQTRRLWDWLKRFTAPDEPMLRRLRRASRVRLHHPTTMAPKKAQFAWDEYLAARRSHHLIWLAVNLVVSPLSLLLAPIPGPNVVGYWFVYRAACHLLALFGIRRAGSRSATMELLPSASLDLPPDADGEDRAAAIAARLRLRGLDDYLDRVGEGRAEPTLSPDDLG